MKTAAPRPFLTAISTASALALCLGLAACGHKAVPVPPAPPAPAASGAPAPTITASVTPDSIESGAKATLSWKSDNAVRVELDGSPINLSGSQAVTPTDSTTYQLIARGADGQTATATARLTVTAPAAPEATAPPASSDIGGSFSADVRDAFFDYDKSDIRPDAEPVLQADAQFFKTHPGTKIVIEGHCDDRGSAEYNLALGDRRAEAVKNYLVSQGIDASRLDAVSVGKEKPFCTQDTDDCRQQNRRGHFSPGQ